jgi:hypothetical protein
MSNQFHYDFFRKELWLARSHNLGAFVDTNFNLLREVLVTVGGLTTEKFTELVAQTDSEGRKGVGQLDHLHSRLADKLSTSSGQWYGSQIDIDFEARQLLNLYTFLLELYNFREIGFNRIIEQTLLQDEQAHQLPPAYLIRESLKHMGDDLEIIQRAIVQRSREKDSAGNYIMSFLSRALVVIDKLVYMALAPFTHLLPSDPNPISFFSQNTYIHHVPYSDKTVLIGIRNDCIELDINKTSLSPKGVMPAFEIMAIPHEVGHYVYRHGKTEGGESFANLANHFQEVGHPYHHWCEEIFADVYSCMIAGPLAVLGM